MRRRVLNSGHVGHTDGHITHLASNIDSVFMSVFKVSHVSNQRSNFKIVIVTANLQKRKFLPCIRFPGSLGFYTLAFQAICGGVIRL